jgi:leucyl-tRNA synthetase
LVHVKEPFKKLINQGMIQGVIEYIYLLKEKKNGFAHFICSSLAKQLDLDESQYSKIPVHVSFVQNYGASDSYLNLESFKQFIEWRPDYANAIFECSKGYFQNGIFKPKTDAEGPHLFTHSEIGKMSKRYYNVINPDDVVEAYGADCFRMYEMFLGPVEQSKPWDTNGIDGVSKFLRRLWSLFFDETGKWQVIDTSPSAEENKVLHTCIKRVREDIERFSFNTCVSQFMVCINELKKMKCHKKAILSDLLLLLAPFAPFTTDELWERMGHTRSIHFEKMPHFDPAHLKEDMVAYPVCVNGKKRATLSIASESTNSDKETAALQLEAIQKWTEGKVVRKVIIVPGRMINIVV